MVERLHLSELQPLSWANMRDENLYNSRRLFTYCLTFQVTDLQCGLGKHGMCKAGFDVAHCTRFIYTSKVLHSAISLSSMIVKA